MATATTVGSYYVPFTSREGDRTPDIKTYYQGATAGAANDADHTLGALALSGTSDFIVTYVAVSVHTMTLTASYNVLVGGETVCTLKGADAAGDFRELTFGIDGLRVTGQTSTSPMVQFVSSNAAATASSKTLVAKGHYV